MIYTSSYRAFKDADKLLSCSISFDHGKDAGYSGNIYPDLFPLQTFWRPYKNNIGKIPEEENYRYYVREYWKQVLAKLDPEKVYKDLDYTTLLCYEDNDKFCHRHIVASWFEILLDVKVDEVIGNNYAVEVVDKPAYIKKYLEEAMREGRNMRGFASLRALYLYEKGEALEEEADRLEQEGKYCDSYRQAACYYRCEADMVESAYRTSKKVLKIKPLDN